VVCSEAVFYVGSAEIGFSSANFCYLPSSNSLTVKKSISLERFLVQINCKSGPSLI
jgi:hypothetical protein